MNKKITFFIIFYIIWRLMENSIDITAPSLYFHNGVGAVLVAYPL